MVEFLVEHGADVNRGDKEGWTPLHATTSCGFVSIAKLVLSICSYPLSNVINMGCFFYLYRLYEYTFFKCLEFSATKHVKYFHCSFSILKWQIYYLQAISHSYF